MKVGTYFSWTNAHKESIIISITSLNFQKPGGFQKLETKIFNPVWPLTKYFCSAVLPRIYVGDSIQSQSKIESFHYVTAFEVVDIR